MKKLLVSVLLCCMCLGASALSDGEMAPVDRSSCRVLTLQGDQTPDKGASPLFDGKYMSRYHAFDEIGYRYFGWNCQSETPWFTFDIGSVERLAKMRLMPYSGFEQRDPAVFQIWAYTAPGEVPEVTLPGWKEDGNWVKVMDADLSFYFDRTRDLAANPEKIGKAETDPCVDGATLYFGNGNGAPVKARYYRFCVEKCFFGAFASETKKQWFNRFDCSIAEMELWKCTSDIPDYTIPETPAPKLSERPGDMVLLYCGNVKHSEAEDLEIRFADYLVTDEKQPRWLFDGILFLEIVYNYKYTYMGANQSRKYEPATLEHIEFLWHNWFSKLLPKLDRQVGKLKTKALNAPEKEKIELMLPVLPFRRECGDWGAVEGLNTTDFYSWDNVLTIYSYLIDRLVGQFNAGKFENLELTGIYWPEEGAGIAPARTRQIAALVHAKGLNFDLIPYYNPGFERNMFSCWKDYGFDGFYLQPNYFNKEEATKEKLVGACAMASKYGFDNELEFSLDRFPDSPQRFADYMDVFEQMGCFENKRLAYYQDMAEISKMRYSRNDDPERYALYRRLCKYVADRREKK